MIKYRDDQICDLFLYKLRFSHSFEGQLYFPTSGWRVFLKCESSALWHLVDSKMLGAFVSVQTESKQTHKKHQSSFMTKFTERQINSQMWKFRKGTNRMHPGSGVYLVLAQCAIMTLKHSGGTRFAKIVALPKGVCESGFT